MTCFFVLFIGLIVFVSGCTNQTSRNQYVCPNGDVVSDSSLCLKEPNTQKTYCGDRNCQSGETCKTCSQDCGYCKASANDVEIIASWSKIDFVKSEGGFGSNWETCGANFDYNMGDIEGDVEFVSGIEGRYICTSYVTGSGSSDNKYGYLDVYGDPPKWSGYFSLSTKLKEPKTVSVCCSLCDTSFLDCEKSFQPDFCKTINIPAYC